MSRRRVLLLVGKLSSEMNNFSLHLRVLAPLPYSFEVGFNLALQVETAASRAEAERFLHNITS